MEIVIRATAVYWLLWLLVRGTGKRSLAELSPMELLVMIVLGDLAQQAVTQEDMSIVGGAVVASVVVGWTLLSSALEHRSRRLSTLLSGDPVVLVLGGRVFEDRLHSERLSLDDLREAAREHGIASLADVDVAVLEADGKISFLEDARGAGSPGQPEPDRTEP